MSKAAPEPIVRVALPRDHDGICEVAKKNKYTKGATSPHYLSESAYTKGWVGIVKTKRGRIVGFTCVRHLSRDTYTSLYYIGVDPEFQGKGIGHALVNWVMITSPHDRIRLICEKANEDSVAWYHRRGFEVVEDGANKAGEEYWRFELVP